MTTENQHNTLTQVIRTMAQLVANCPYHQLSKGYVRRVTASIEQYSKHRGVLLFLFLCYQHSTVSITPVKVIKTFNYTNEQHNNSVVGTVDLNTFSSVRSFYFF